MKIDYHQLSYIIFNKKYHFISILSFKNLIYSKKKKKKKKKKKNLNIINFIIIIKPNPHTQNKKIYYFIFLSFNLLYYIL